MYLHKLNFEYAFIFLLCSIKVVPQIEHPVALCIGEELKLKTCFDVFYGDRACARALDLTEALTRARALIPTEAITCAHAL